MNRDEEADSCYSAAIQKDPMSANATYLKAAIENKKGNFEEAIELYSKALERDQCLTLKPDRSKLGDGTLLA